MSYNNPTSGDEYSILRELLRSSNIDNMPLNSDEVNMQEQIINFYPHTNLTPFNIINPDIPNSGQNGIHTDDNYESINGATEALSTYDQSIQSVGQMPDEVPISQSNSSLNPQASPFLPGAVPELGTTEEVEDYDMPPELEEGPPPNSSRIAQLLEAASPEILSLLTRVASQDIITPDASGNIPNLYNFDVPLDVVSSLFYIRNPPGPTYEPNYLIEHFKELELGISEIDYPYDGSLIKIYIPTIMAVDNPYCQRLIRGQIINLKDILKEKEAALEIAYFIKTGEITPEVQPHHDELSGYSKQPLSQDNMKELKYKNIKDTPILETLDESSSCSICQTPIKELLETDQEVIVLECGDYFCKDCIFQWLEQYQNKCPNCNKDLSSVEEEPKPRLTREEILENNYYKAAYFIIRYCSYYRQKQDMNVMRLDQLNELFIQQGGLVSMNDCKTILEF